MSPLRLSSVQHTQADLYFAHKGSTLYAMLRNGDGDMCDCSCDLNGEWSRLRYIEDLTGKLVTNIILRYSRLHWQQRG